MTSQRHRRPARTHLVALLALTAGAPAIVACGGSTGGPQAGSPATVSAHSSSRTGTPLRTRTALAHWHLTQPISRSVAFVAGDRIVLAGGLISGDRSIGDVTSFDPANGSHQSLARLAQPSHDAAGVTLAGSHYLVGGGSASGLATVQQVSTTSASATVGRLPQPRSDLAAVVVGQQAYVLGGYTGTSLPGQVLVTTDGRQFRTHGALAIPVRYAAVAALGNAIYLFGGQDSAGAPIADVQRYDVRTGHCRVVGHLPVALSGASAMVLGGRILVAGGRLAGGGVTGAVLAWSRGKLHRVAELRRPVANAAVAVRGTTAWLLGGEAAADLATVQTVSVTGGGS